MTNSLVDLSMYIKTLITNSNAFNIVTYGDVDRISESKTACVEPDTKNTEYYAIGRKVKRTFVIYVLMYFAHVSNPEFNREYVDRAAESMETIIHADPQLNNNVTESLVTQVASGYARKDGILVRSSRLTITATSYDILPSSL